MFIKTEEDRYGKSILNPIKIKGVRASIAFMNLLITEDEKPFLFHRLKLTYVNDSKPIDCYEILKPNGEKEMVFIDIYCTQNKSLPPIGYKIKRKKITPAVINGFLVMETTGVNYKLIKFPDELF